MKQSNVGLARPGFSLIEILVAITIISIMIGVAVGAFQYLGRTKVTATQSNLQSIKTAIISFHSDVGSYPAILSNLIVKPSDQKLSKRWQGPYLEQEPIDGWKNPFVYQINPKGSKQPYELYSWGPNGEGSPADEHISVWG